MSEIVGLGTDIVECLRIAQMIERHGEQFVNRVFTGHEIDVCSGRASATQQFAGRWAAKEAVVKALNVDHQRGFSWRDIEVREDGRGNLSVRFGGAARRLCEKRQIGSMLVSISYCRSHATATAIAVRELADP